VSSQGAPQPARWASVPSQACVQQLQAFAEKQTGNKVLGAATAFSQGDQWVLDPAVPTDAAGRPLDGRQRPVAPEVFKLTLQGNSCQVMHEATRAMLTLQGCPCVALAVATPR
jgi:hypothetical protein